MTLEERVKRWPEPYIEQGVRQGIERGLERQREMLRRQAAARFDEDVAERLFARLRDERSEERLSTIGEAIVRCRTGDDLLRQAAG